MHARALIDGDYGEAISHYRQAVELNPMSPPALMGLGRVLENSGNPEEALEHLEKFLRISPKDQYVGSVYSGMGCAYLQLGEYETVIEFFYQGRPDPNETRRPALTGPGSCLGAPR